MPNKQEIARQNLAKFEDWIAERDTVGDWNDYLRNGQIIRTAIVEACGFGRSALIQNPAVAALLRSTEERLAYQGTPLAAILEQLEAFLEAKLAGDEPTLPTRDGKIDLDAVAREIGLPGKQQQLISDAACRSVLNAAATALGLASVSSREELNANDAVAHAQLTRVRAAASEYATTLAEREATIIQLRRRIAQLDEQLAIRNETGMLIRTAPIK